MIRNLEIVVSAHSDFLRLPVLLLGALLPIFSNAVYSDLAAGAPSMQQLISIIPPAASDFVPGDDPTISTLYDAIFIKNIISSTASAIFVGHLATLVSKEFAAVQCAINSSISFTAGTLLSAMAGEYIDQHGFAEMTWVASGSALLAGVIVVAMSHALSGIKSSAPNVAAPL